MKENLKHLAIILDGNRRWAVEQGKPKIFGHTQGAKNLKRVLTTAKKHNITHITTWALSIDNLKRDEKELKHLFSLFEKLFGYIGQLNKENIKVNFIGDLSLLPASTEKKLLNIKKQTKNNTGLVWTLALAYGGRHEIVRATKKIIEQGIKAKKLNEEVFSSFLDTHNLPEVSNPNRRTETTFRIFSMANRLCRIIFY
jgi:undecaprenyl diphosphate synthase